MEALAKIQQELKAPKKQYNSFGKYSYRSCEDILEAVKPLLDKHKCVLTITDSTQEIAGIPVVFATASLHNKDGDLFQVSAQAGVDLNRKGMDVSQSFGASSSYARKYALNGLFLIDDTRHADATNTHGKQAEPVQHITDQQYDDILSLMTEVKADKDKFCKYFQVAELDELPASKYEAAVKMLERKR